MAFYQPVKDTLPGAHMFVACEGVHYRREQPEHAIEWRKAIEPTVADYDGSWRRLPIRVTSSVHLEGERFNYSFGRADMVGFYVYAQTERERYAVAHCTMSILRRLTTHNVPTRRTKNERRHMARQGHTGRRGARSVAATKMVQDTDYTAVRYIVSGNPGMWEEIARQVERAMVGRV